MRYEKENQQPIRDALCGSTNYPPTKVDLICLSRRGLINQTPSRSRTLKSPGAFVLVI
jgi:hypothetical protein